MWEGIPPDGAPGAVQALVSRARRLGFAIEAAPGGYRLPTDGLRIDVVDAEALLSAGRQALRSGDTARARDLARDARSLVPAVPDLDDPATAHLLTEVVTLQAEAGLALGQVEDLVEDLRRCALRTPPDEPLVALLVRVLAAQGRDAEAIEVVERLRTDLADRYGTDPSPVVSQVHLALLRGELAPDPVRVPPPPRTRGRARTARARGDGRRPRWSAATTTSRRSRRRSGRPAWSRSSRPAVRARRGWPARSRAARRRRGGRCGSSSWPVCARPPRCCPPCSPRSAGRT